MGIRSPKHLMHQRNMRQAVLRIMGYKCVKCGYNADWRALQIDHINGCGNKNRKSGLQISEEIIKFGFDGKYQLLCANCNFIKRYENNELSTGRQRYIESDKSQPNLFGW